MIQSAITISLVSAARGGPFVLWDDLSASMELAAKLGFDAVELFLPSPDAISIEELRAMLRRHGLRVAAVGTGAGWVMHKLSLTSGEMEKREAARLFVQRMIDFGAELDAPAILGSMQGRSESADSREAALDHLAEALGALGQYAAERGQVFLYEPLNRYETNLCNTLAGGVELLQRSGAAGMVKLLADLFHMNIEEADMAGAIREAGEHIGHVHFADSNRQAMGCGHTDAAPIVEALRQIGYAGYASAEVFALPDSRTAAQRVIEAHRRWFS